MSQNNISHSLLKLFDKYRIVFWYDSDKNLREDYDNLTFSPEDNIEKIELDNNEIFLKHLMLREKREQNFLVYHEGSKPEDKDNWLLDVLLSHVEFHADKTSLFLFELGLDREYVNFVNEHIAFFNNKDRVKKFKKYLTEFDKSFHQLSINMFAIVLDCSPRMDSILEALLSIFEDDEESLSKKMKEIANYNLSSFLWKELKKEYGYSSDSPSIEEFAIKLFTFCYERILDEKHRKVRFSAEAEIFINRWKDNRQFAKCFENLSHRYADVLEISKHIEDVDYRELVSFDCFEVFEQKIISDLNKHIVNKTATFKEIKEAIDSRKKSFWYSKYEHIYRAMIFAIHFFEELALASLMCNSLSGAIQEYARNWYKIDKAYRKVIYHINAFGKRKLLENLLVEVENHYTHTFLGKLAQNFQFVVDSNKEWQSSSVLQQKNFYREEVLPYIEKKKKICVIISDALRYEAGKELCSLLLKENRFSAEIKPMLAQIPTYTQLGMASLLPNTEISIAEDSTGTVLVDGISTQGTENRGKILKSKYPQSTACVAKEFLSLRSLEKRDFVRDNHVIYLYHNVIDAIGDDSKTEKSTFDAVENALLELTELIKALTSANINNLIITADHGFLYQNKDLDEGDFLNVQATGDEIYYSNRRFVLGKNLEESQNFVKFSANQLGLVGNIEAQFPKTIHRLRKQGSGYKFVHGGTTLQEIVLPVLSINKKRQDDTSFVEVDVISPSINSPITSGQFTVLLYQRDVVTKKVHPRKLRVGLYTKNGELLSESYEINFESKSENTIDREEKLRFILSQKAESCNNQIVELRLEEQYGQTQTYTLYKSVPYIIRRSFTSDFDF